MKSIKVVKGKSRLEQFVIECHQSEKQNRLSESFLSMSCLSLIFDNETMFIYLIWTKSISVFFFICVIIDLCDGAFRSPIVHTIRKDLSVLAEQTESHNYQYFFQPFGIQDGAITSPVLITSRPSQGTVSKNKMHLKREKNTHTQATRSTRRHNPFQGYLISVSDVLTSWGWERSSRGADGTQNNMWLLSTRASQSSWQVLSYLWLISRQMQ